jgi:NMT1/THI5 like
VVQALVSGDVNFGMGTATGAVTARAAGEGIITVAVPMNRLDYAFVSRQPISRPADLNGKKVGVAGVGGADNFATRVALEKLGINPASVTMLAIGSSADRLAALRAGSVDAAIIGGGTFIGSGTGLHKLVDLTELGIEFPMTAIFTANKYAVANRDSVFGFIRGYMRGVRFFQERKGEAIVIAARNLRTSNTDLIERQWQYAKSYMFEKIPYPTERVSSSSSISSRQEFRRYLGCASKTYATRALLESWWTKDSSNSDARCEASGTEALDAELISGRTASPTCCNAQLRGSGIMRLTTQSTVSSLRGMGFSNPVTMRIKPGPRCGNCFSLS